jgi:TrmH family RNA methyltransferase
LGRRSARVDEGAFVVEGPSLVDHAVRAGWELEAVFVAAGHWSYRPPANDVADTPIYELAPNVMERVATTESPQPVLGVVRRRVATLDELSAATLVLVADRVGDPGNAGTMLRSAEAAGADAVVLTQGSVDVFNPKVVRSSAGALFEVPVVVDVSMDDVLRALTAPAGRLRSFGTTSHQGEWPGSSGTDDHPHIARHVARYTDVDLSVPSLVVVGNEAAGLDAGVAVEQWITVPHAGRAESLNVAMAATVVLFEVARQRQGG